MQISCGCVGNLRFSIFSLIVTLSSSWILASSSAQKFEFRFQNFCFISEFVFFQRIRKFKYPFKTSYKTTPTVKLSSAVLKSRLRPRGIWLRLDKNTVTILNGVISRHFLDFVDAIVQFASCSLQFPCVTLQNRLSISWWSKADRFSTTLWKGGGHCKLNYTFSLWQFRYLKRQEVIIKKCVVRPKNAIELVWADIQKPKSAFTVNLWECSDIRDLLLYSLRKSICNINDKLW